LTGNIPVGVVSLGCSKNRVDTEQFLGVLRDEGYIFTKDIDEARVVIINTCAFIQSAKEESIDAILDIVEYKKKDPGKRIIVTGCLPERYRETLATEIPEVDGWIGVNQYGLIASIVSDVLDGGTPKIYDIHAQAQAQRLLTTPSHLAYVRIAEGCDLRCSYCAIPAIRGHYRSRPMEDIEAECCQLASMGVKELVLVAQDSSYYGRDLYGSFRLAELLLRLGRCKVPWIRVLYTYPERIDEALLHAMETAGNVIAYLDMPLQHIDSDILKNMGRPMTQEGIESLLMRIRQRKTQFTLRTTLIAGFPGENEAQHEKLLQFVGRGLFDHVGVFGFSREEGTRAATMDGQTDLRTIQRRVRALKRAAQTAAATQKADRIGSTVEAIIESVGQTGQGIGRTLWQAPEVDGVIRVTGCGKEQIGNIIRCRITGANAYDFIGEYTYDAGK
jgi:ribosomal protein S12 methylthiotransferase